jgi:hypothetical protein
MKDQNETKQCRHCKLELPLHKYHLDRRNVSGSYSVCKDCRSSYRRLINIPKKEYDKILESQNNQCAICGTDAKEFKSALGVDHDYKTNKIRGLLCTNCNMGLGHFKDSLTNLNQALEYLDKHND